MRLIMLLFSTSLYLRFYIFLLTSWAPVIYSIAGIGTVVDVAFFLCILNLTPITNSFGFVENVMVFTSIVVSVTISALVCTRFYLKIEM
jgi:hypothetical protein